MLATNSLIAQSIFEQAIAKDRTFSSKPLCIQLIRGEKNCGRTVWKIVEKLFKTSQKEPF
jgi:hypothetical protein